MHGDIDRNDPRLRGNPNPEESQRMVDDVLKQFKQNHKPAPLSDVELAIQKAKRIHLEVLRVAHSVKDADEKNGGTYSPDSMRSLLMKLYRDNFHTLLSRDEMIEVLAVMHTEISLGLLR